LKTWPFDAGDADILYRFCEFEYDIRTLLQWSAVRYWKSGHLSGSGSGRRLNFTVHHTHDQSKFYQTIAYECNFQDHDVCPVPRNESIC
jgi:hypothetical protein